MAHKGHSGEMALLPVSHPRDLMDEQWALIGPLLPTCRKDRRGRPWKENRALPKRLIGDNAYESDRLDAALARRGVELIAPYRRSEHIGRKTVDRSVATVGGGRSSDSLLGSRTFDDTSCAVSHSPRTFSGCYTWPAALFCCEVCEMPSRRLVATIFGDEER